jgi:hypothetical protein
MLTFTYRKLLSTHINYSMGFPEPIIHPRHSSLDADDNIMFDNNQVTVMVKQWNRTPDVMSEFLLRLFSRATLW